jgi:hypothetical protein
MRYALPNAYSGYDFQSLKIIIYCAGHDIKMTSENPKNNQTICIG